MTELRDKVEKRLLKMIIAFQNNGGRDLDEFIEYGTTQILRAVHIDIMEYSQKAGSHDVFDVLDLWEKEQSIYKIGRVNELE